MSLGLYMLVLPIETILDAYRATATLYGLVNAVDEAEVAVEAAPHDPQLAAKVDAAKHALGAAQGPAIEPLEALDKHLLQRFIDDELIELGTESKPELARYLPAFVFVVTSGFPTQQSATFSAGTLSEDSNNES